MSELTFLLLGYALEHLLASGIIALVVLALCRTSAIPPGVKAGILLAALMLSVLGPVLSRPIGVGADAGSPSSQLDSQAGAVPMPVSEEASIRIDPDIENTASWIPSRIRIGEPLAMLLVAVWCLGAAWQIARQARGYWGLRRIIAISQRSRMLEERYRHLLPSDVEIRVCASFGPAVVGALHPKILVPARLLATLPQDAMRAVILHEASHIRRNDMLALVFQKIVEALFWWNPAIRWMAASLDVSREIACDIEASRSCETPVDYADALLTAIEHAVPSPGVRFAPALGMADALRTLDRRIDGIIQARAASGATAKLASMAVLLSMAAACVAAEAVSRPLAPMPAVSPDIPSVARIAPKPAVIEMPNKAAGPNRIATADIVSAGQIASKPKAGAAAPGNAKGVRAIAEKPASRLPAGEALQLTVAQANEAFQRTATRADEAFQRTATQADEAFQRSASQADQEYIAATKTADTAYQRRFAELERVTPSAAFELRLTQISRARTQAVSAASGKHKVRMAAAEGKYETQMASANRNYKWQMAGANERYASAMKAVRMN